MSTNPALSTQICRPARLVLCGLAGLLISTAADAEDGYDLWLRYRPLPTALRETYARHATTVVVEGTSPTLAAAAAELRRGLGGLLDRPLSSGLSDGAILLTSARCARAGAYSLRSTRRSGHPVTVISGCGDVGTLYGALALLRLIQTRRPIDHLDLHDSPKLRLRMLDHWDNLDGTVERGYSGPSLWNWRTLPRIDQRMIDYARADASVGINAVVLNNVNADARILTPGYLRKVAALADAWRPYGIRVFLAARFSAPMDLGHLKSADPLNPAVRAWWRAKTDETYGLIPDFGGFLVKANSEGQPGPRTYGRSHADGANMIASVLAPHGGTLLWRAFVYSGSKADDRAKQAYDEFVPLDGKFAANVIVQVKNGPIDFQPREPFHPLLGAMPKTHLAMEAQVTREYLGENAGIAWLGTMWSEALRSRTARPNPASRVEDTVTALAGVANTGSDRNWSGSDFDQANWYALGRLAWNPSADPQTIAEEWTRMTWGNDPSLVQRVVAMMLGSREAVVDVMTPLGLAHQMATDHHYGPGPWIRDLPTPMWNPAYYNRADHGGIGFDRTRSGSNAVSQYAPEVARCFADLQCVPETELLWFHHLRWTHRMPTGQTVWDGLVIHYDRGLSAIASMDRTWARLGRFMDPERHAAVAASLHRQHREARWWRDASIAYFQSLSGLPLPAGHAPPLHPLSWYKAIHFATVPGFLKPMIPGPDRCVVTAGGPPCAP